MDVRWTWARYESLTKPSPCQISELHEFACFLRKKHIPPGSQPPLNKEVPSVNKEVMRHPQLGTPRLENTDSNTPHSLPRTPG